MLSDAREESLVRSNFVLDFSPVSPSGPSTMHQHLLIDPTTLRALTRPQAASFLIRAAIGCNGAALFPKVMNDLIMFKVSYMFGLHLLQGKGKRITRTSTPSALGCHSMNTPSGTLVYHSAFLVPWVLGLQDLISDLP